MSNPSLFRTWLRRRRQEHGLTQEDLGERVGYSAQTIAKIEGGQRPACVVSLIALHCRRQPASIDDVISAVDIHDAARDQLRAVECQEGGRGADVVDADEAPCRRSVLRLVHQLVEFGNS